MENQNTTYHYKRNKKTFSISISPELYNKIHLFAKSERRSMSNLIELLLLELFEIKEQE